MTSFFSRLSYSFGNEDPQTEQRALCIKPKDQVLCISASGDRPLNLLVDECQRMVCIDANLTQNYLLLLKAAAMRALSYQDYLAFLGATPCKHRLSMLQAIIPFLDPKVAKFWQDHPKLIKRGVLYQGAVERLTTIVAACLSVIRRNKVKHLFRFDDLEEQKKFVREQWDSYLWRRLFDTILNPFLSRYLIEDPGLTNIGAAINPGLYIYERINHYLQRDLAKRSILLSLLFQGKVFPEAFSPYLTEEGITMIKARLGCLDVCTMDILDYLKLLPGPTFDVFSLSDVASYLSHPQFVLLLKEIVRTAKPGARFCMRQFLSSHEIPSDYRPYFVRDLALEKKLEEQDSCFVYRFWVGHVSQASQLREQGHHLREEELLTI